MKTTAKWCYVLALLGAAAARPALAQPSGPVIVLVGESPNTEFIGAAYQNDFADLVHLRFQPDTATGRWQPLRLPTAHALWLQFDHQSQQYAVLARPGDTLYLQTHPGQRVYYTFRARHGTAARSAELNFFNSLLKNGLDIGIPDYANLFANARYPRQVEQFCAKYDRRLEALQRQHDSLGFSPAFFGYAAQQLRARYLSALLYPYWDKERVWTQLPASYAQLLATANVPQFLAADSLALSSPLRRAVAISYVQYLGRDSVGTPAELPAKYRLARAALVDHTRDYVLFMLLKQAQQQGLPAYATLRGQFARDCRTPAYGRYLDSLATRPGSLSQRPELLNATLRAPDGTTLTWAQLLARNRGKVLYLDLWASWCGPCLAEMPASAQLQQALASQPVQFVFLSIDQDAAQWQQAVAQHKLARPGSQHYLLGPASPLARFLNAPPIPRYVLLDQQGQVVALDANRPSSPLLPAELTRLLK